jgi:hypothetical protein
MTGAGHAFSTQSPITTPDRSSIRLISEHPSHTRSLSNISTGYSGAQGILDDSINTEYTGYNLPSTPSRAYTPDRPAIGSRLLSSLQNAQPTAAAISRSTSVLHSRAKSLAARLSQNSPTATPSPEARPQSSQLSHSNKLFGDLFNGESAPVRLGIPPSSPIKELEEMEFPTEYRTAFTERPRKRASMLNSTPQSAKTSWFGRKLASPMHQQQPQQPPAAANNELANMNIMASLFPNGQPDELTPYVYNDLLVNATNLLQRMQSAYKDKVEYIATLQPEMDIQREEIEEADIRSRHLKLQLQDMGRRAQEQESAMQALASQLSQERFRNQEAREKESRKASRSYINSRPSPVLSNADETTDDDETTPRRFPHNKRLSAGSTSASDSGFESDLDRDSWVHQDPLDPSHQRTVMGSPGPLTPTKQRGLVGNQHAPLTSSSLRNSVKRLGSDGSAWAVMERLRVENVALKAQVGDMQRELQGCIELIGHMRL